MDSALTPREIQSRIRAGESLEDVARAAGVPVDSIEGYAAPVLAEREHIAALAHSAQVRQASSPDALSDLEEVVTPRLASRGVEPDSVLWDAWREEDRADRHWTVRISYQSGSAGHEALFDFDHRGRYATPVNSDAQWLVGEEPPRSRPAPRPRTDSDPDDEPTIDLNDELALVRAVQDDETPTIAGGSALAELYAAAKANHGTTGKDELVDGVLEERDGVYEIVPNPPSDMDVLYDMLAGFDEDSVHVYSGLGTPVQLDGNTSPDGDGNTSPDGTETADDGGDDAPEPDAAANLAEQQAETHGPGSTLKQPAVQPEEPEQHETAESTDEPSAQSDQPAGQQDSPDQEPLVKGTHPAASAKTTKRSRRRRSHRATVPTWDEIMFGGPSDGREKK